MKLTSILSILGAALIMTGGIITTLAAFDRAETHVQAAESQEVLREQLTTTTLVESDDPLIEWDQPEDFVPPSQPVEVELPEYDLGDPIAEIAFPTLDHDAILVEGGLTGDENEHALKTGPAHMPWTVLPGQEGNSVISGHRTTYGADFHDLDLLEAGDPILVGDLEFTVTEIHIVAPDEMWVAEDRGGTTITLTTCHPKGSAQQRLVVFADAA